MKYKARYLELLELTLVCSTSLQKCEKVFAAQTDISEEKHQLYLLPKTLGSFAELLNPCFLASRYYPSLNCHPIETTKIQQADINNTKKLLGLLFFL